MKVIETKLPAGAIIDITKLPDGTWVVKQKVAEDRKPMVSNEIPDFILIEAEKLSLKDEFMQYEPETDEEAITKELIAEAIEKGVKNFYRPTMDPAFTPYKRGIQFVAGRKPAVGKSYNWWDKVAKEFNPERNSRLGTRLQYGAFLGGLIKKFIEEGNSVEWAWNAVCNDSRELGHYWNSENAKHAFEPTGSRSICGLCDLANTCKILAEDEEAGGFWLAGGFYNFYGNAGPLADLNHDTLRFIDDDYSVGWLVLS